MSKLNPHFSNNNDNDDLEGKGRDATPGLTKDDSSTMVYGDAGGDIDNMSSPERAEVQREGITGTTSMRGAAYRPPLPKNSAWAVLIGIDGYKELPLRGCVSDARLMKDYLINYAAISVDHIQCLLGPSEGNDDRSGDSSLGLLPSRKNIIETLESLAHNEQIYHGSDIIIFYAGHGSSYPYPTGNIETLCPIDRNSDIHFDINDREINEILHRISSSKGNRITVILDCCYSGGATRAQDRFRFRSIPPLPNVSARSMLLAADEYLHLSGSHGSLSASGWRPIMDSHVILTACRDTETAREIHGRGSEGCNGAFTVALLDALKSKLLTCKSTYVDLLKNLVVDGQKPVLAGKNRFSKLGDLMSAC